MSLVQSLYGITKLCCDSNTLVALTNFSYLKTKMMLPISLYSSPADRR
jgi:hypothetical protein